MNDKKIITTTTILIVVILVIGIIFTKSTKEEIMVDGIYTKMYSAGDGEYIFVEPADLKFYDEDFKYSINEAFEKDVISIKRLKNRSTSSLHVNDGESILYYFENTKIANKDFIMCICNDVNGNRNTYIIPFSEGDLKIPCSEQNFK